MPRNVVTVVRRRSLLRRGADRHERQDRVLQRLAERYRVRWRPAGDGVEIDFPKRLGRRAAKDRVVGDLSEIDAGWARVLAVYPAERNIRGDA